MRAKGDIWRAMAAQCEEAVPRPHSRIMAGVPGVLGGPVARRYMEWVEMGTRADVVAVFQFSGGCGAAMMDVGDFFWYRDGVLLYIYEALRLSDLVKSSFIYVAARKWLVDGTSRPPTSTE